VIDHVVPLKRGGADAPTNMQWQTKADAKAKGNSAVCILKADVSQMDHAEARGSVGATFRP
jgi:hypothetical protein